MFHFRDNSIHLGYTCSDNLSGLSHELFNSAGLKNLISQQSVEVSLVAIPPKSTMESLFTASLTRLSEIFLDQSHITFQN